MYQKFYGLNSKPFHITPDLDFLFMSPNHKVALDCMEFGLMNNAGIILITGEIGMGKTTLIRRLIKLLDKDIRPACIYNTNLNPEQFLALAMQEFGLEAEINNKGRNIHSMQQSLQNMRGDGQRPLLIVDDAQNLALEVLEEVRWLSGLQDEKGMLLQIMLVGQPELRIKLGHPSMASLSQRIGVSYFIKPFTREEAEAYILHRLLKAGRSQPLFSKAAIDAIYEVAKGIPRTINLLCDNALVYGFADGLEQIDTPVIEQVVVEIGSYGVGFNAPSKASENAVESKNQPANGAAQEGKNGAENRVLREGINVILQKLKKLEERTGTLERSLAIYSRELQQVLRDQFMEERRRNERLTLQYAKLKIKLMESTTSKEPETISPVPLPIRKKVQE